MVDPHFREEDPSPLVSRSVSYTHLDVYKRQLLDRPSDEPWQWPPHLRAKSRAPSTPVTDRRLPGIVCEKTWRDQFYGNALIIGKSKATVYRARGLADLA